MQAGKADRRGKKGRNCSWRQNRGQIKVLMKIHWLPNVKCKRHGFFYYQKWTQFPNPKAQPNKYNIQYIRTRRVSLLKRLIIEHHFSIYKFPFCQDCSGNVCKYKMRIMSRNIRINTQHTMLSILWAMKWNFRH